jgi:hypothetical protein
VHFRSVLTSHPYSQRSIPPPNLPLVSPMLPHSLNKQPKPKYAIPSRQPAHRQISDLIPSLPIMQSRSSIFTQIHSYIAGQARHPAFPIPQSSARLKIPQNFTRSKFPLRRQNPLAATPMQNQHFLAGNDRFRNPAENNVASFTPLHVRPALKSSRFHSSRNSQLGLAQVNTED